MTWTIEFDLNAKSESNKIDPQIAKRISTFLDERLSQPENPRLLEAPLQGAKFSEF